MKLSLSRFACDELMIRIPAVGALRQRVEASGHLVTGWAWAGYRRDSTQHAVVVSLQDETFVIRFITGEGATPPSRRGEPFEALELLATPGVSLDWNVHADFAFHGEGHVPQLKMRIPVKLFTPGSFPFTELRGYRAMNVSDEGETLWSAVVDCPEPDESLTIGITLPNWDSCDFQMALRECVRVRDSLLAEES